MTSSIQNLDHLKIPLEDILEATNHFSNENFVRQGGFGKIYKGKLNRSGKVIDIVARRLDTKYGQGTKEFWTEILMLSRLKHKNLVSLIGFCDEKNMKIVVNKYEAKGSLDNYLSDPSLTWLQRLQICVGVARALNYIHYDEKRDFSVIHRNIKSSKILLDDNYEPKLAGFNLSITNIASRRHRVCITDPCGTIGYVDPTYVKTGSVAHMSDIYSYGLVLFEVLFGSKAITNDQDIKLTQLAKSHYEEGQLDDRIDPDLRKQMNQKSFDIFSQIAYYCLKEQRAERPKIDQIVVRLEEALNLQWNHENPDHRAERPNIDQTVVRLKEALNLQRVQENPESAHSTSSNRWKVNESILSSSLQEFAHLQIPLEDIESATSNFADEKFIGHGGFGKLYRGKLLRSGKLIDIVTHRLDGIISGQGVVEFSMEISMLSIIKHENVVSFLGFCNENGEKIIIYEHAVHGSLDQYLSDPTLTWSQRLQICIGVARALNHIHYDVIHCNVNSSQVLIDKDWEAKVYGFGLSTIYPESWSHRLLFSPYFDASGSGDAFLTPKYDVYSFGRILSEVFSKWKEIAGDSGVNQSPAAMAARHHVEKKLGEHIDPNPREQVESQTLTMFSEIANKCLNQYMQRPSMDQILKELGEVLELHESKHKDLEPPTNADEGTSSSSRLKEEDIECLEIPLSDIMLATNNFNPAYLIGKGGYGEVYKADVGHLDFQGISTMEGHSTVAIKRIFNKEGQNKQEFYKEVEMLNSCKHQNVVSLLGISTEDPEMILVCEFASNGSLEDCLEKGKMINVTWAQRLSICLDIAKGLKYLHTEFPQKSRILHRDVKSANILLDEEWNAKISDFGLSKFNPTNQYASTMIFTHIAGTDVYLDPEYMKKGKYKKASDVYSFGIVLFEILSGTLAYNSVYKEGNDKGLATVARRRFNEGTLKELIDPNMMREDNEHIFTLNKGPNVDSLDAFSKIAYECLAETQVRRPTTETIIKELQNAISLQGKTLVLMKFRLSNIVKATNNFSEKYCMGVETYGKMYNAELDQSLLDIDGKNESRLPNRLINVALKRIYNELGHGKKGFLAEIEMLTRCKHPNIVSLLGISCEDREMILVYKDAYKGSLSDCLRNTRKLTNLSWVRRIQISLDIAQGLNYLLSRTEDKQMLMHFEMSSANILLDTNWKAKITCYWHSNLFPANQEASILNTNSTGGTKVHLDPDYIQMVKLKNETGTYSFGVILFEILSGRLENDDIHVVENEKRLTSLARRHFEEGTLNEIIDPNIRIRPNQDSLAAFSKIACQCLAETQARRPTMQVIIEELQNALDLQWKGLEHLRIGLNDIEMATEKFSDKYLIGSGRFGMVYKAQVEHFEKDECDLPKKRSTVAIKRSNNREGEQRFIEEIEILTKCHHENIISLLGFCDEDPDHMILVYELPSKGSLEDYLGYNDKMTNLTWVQRLKICIDIAYGLNYIHNNTDHDKQKIIHGDIKSAYILLGENWKAKISHFGLSKFHPADQDASSLNASTIAGTNTYLDPEYEKSGRLNKKSDIYSFGVVLFEILTGRLAYDPIYTKVNEKGIAFIARHHFEKGTLMEIVDDKIKQETNEHAFYLSKGPNEESLDTFSKIAYRCLAVTQVERPPIAVVSNELKKALYCQENHLDNRKLSLKDIKLATQNFNEDNLIGHGDFGNLYKGHTYGHNVITAKRLGRKSAEGEAEFMTELEILMEYKHENVIGLVGYCDEEDEKVIIYEYASRGSLDRYLSDDSLTWVMRLKICIDIAIGLEFLHGTVSSPEIVIHRDISSSNIHLFDDWKAKITGFGLSLICPTNQNVDYVMDNVTGTIGYRDPLHSKTGFLTKESDIFSLGAVLFDILCGKLSSEKLDDEYIYLPFLAKHHYNEGKLDELVLGSIKEQIVPQSYTTFATIALQCLHHRRESRPTSGEVVIQLKKALEFQEDDEKRELKLPIDYKEIIQMSKCPEIYSTKKKEELYNIFCKGILLQQDKVFLSFFGNGERDVMVSATMFSYIHSCPHEWKSLRESRFEAVVEMLDISNLIIEIKTRAQFLSPNVVYGVYLVFKFCDSRNFSSKPVYVNLKYRKGHKSLHAYFATWRDKQWMMIELDRFLSQNEDVVFEFLLESFSSYYCGDAAVYVEGIEFRAIDKVKHEEIGKLKEVQQVLKSDFNMDQVQQLPTNFEKIYKVCRNYDELFWLGELVGKKLLVLSAKAALYKFSNVDTLTSKPPAQSRFQEVIELLPQQVFHISCTIKSQMLSPDTEYVCYLVFKLSENCQGMHCPVKVRDVLHQENKEAEFLYFITPEPSNIHDITRLPKQREDGWMEIQLWKFNSAHEFKYDSLSMNIKFTSHEGNMCGLIVCGLEFRPL